MNGNNTMKAASVILMLTAFGFRCVLAQEYHVYVANESDDTVSLVRFDTRQATVVKTIPVGSIPTEIEGAHGVTVSPDGHHWYVSVAHGQPYGKVIKFDAATDELLGSVELGLFPATMQISAATGLLFVANFNLHGTMEPSTISVVDADRMQEVGRVTTGPMPHGSRLAPDGTRHYSVAMMNGTLYEIDALKLQVRRTLEVGSKPTWVEHHTEHNRVYVANNGDDEVAVVDLDAWVVSQRIPAAGAPYNLALTPDGTRMIVTLKSASAVSIHDTATGEALTQLATSRRIPHGVVITPDGTYAFVSAEGVGSEWGTVDVIDIETLSLVATVEVGRQAGGIAFASMVFVN